MEVDSDKKEEPLALVENNPQSEVTETLKEEELKEVTLVEKLDSLDKNGGLLFATGLTGVALSILAGPLVGAVSAPLLVSSIGASLAGIVGKSKFAQSYVASKMYKKINRLLKEKNEELQNQDLNVEELANLKYAIDDFENNLNSIKQTCDEKGISPRLF